MPPRPEHPRPQFFRDRWINLNGTWDFAFDFGGSGEERGLHENPEALDQSIVVPFCPESTLSGIGYTDFIPAVWYHRTFDLPAEWEGLRILLHFGAVDYECRGWVNGRTVGTHMGGSVSFTFDITEAVQSGRNTLVVNAKDDTRSAVQPSGKQAHEHHSNGCMYTRTTGIWQTVWLEAVAHHSIEALSVVPDLDGARFVVTPVFHKTMHGSSFKATLFEDGQIVSETSAPAASGTAYILEVQNPHSWSCDDPFLYELRFELSLRGDLVDVVTSYAGLRKFHIEGYRFYLNNEPIFLRFVLDQGFYPDGIWTAPDDSELKADIERSQAVGFNGARLHQKVFEERFHYWADKLGYLTWGEFCDWGLDFTNPQALHNHQREWREVLLRDRCHPSIITWTPFNESIRGARVAPEAHRQSHLEIYEMTRALDPTRPVHDTSGYVHVRTDIYTVHDYDQNTDTFHERYQSVDPQLPENAFIRYPEISLPYGGQPYMVDEYGGTWWVEGSEARGMNYDEGWGYGNRPRTILEFYDRIEKLTATLTQNPHISGFTYTQLTDVEQEENGIYTYDRKLKFDVKRLRKTFGAAAAIERE